MILVDQFIYGCVDLLYIYMANHQHHYRSRYYICTNLFLDIQDWCHDSAMVNTAIFRVGLNVWNPDLNNKSYNFLINFCGQSIFNTTFGLREARIKASCAG